LTKSGNVRLGGYVARRGKKNAYKTWKEMSEGKKTLECHKCKWEENVKMGPGRNGMVWTGLIWLRIGTSTALS
jgi:hypothetical protein